MSTEKLNLNEKKLCDDYRNGKTLDDIAKENKCCRNTVAKYIRQNGMNIRPRGGRNKIWCEDEMSRLKKMFDNGMNTSEIARKEKTSFHNMRKRLIKYGIKK